jgi:hypothetical protein
VVRFIARLAIVVAAVGLAASVVAHVLSFRPGHDVAPPWFLVVFLGIFPLTPVGLYVGYRVGTTHAIWGSRDQWAFFDRHLSVWWIKIRTFAFLYALLRFVWFAATNPSNAATDSGVRLGLFSAFTAVFYLTFVMILKVALSDHTIIPQAGQPMKPTNGGGIAQQLGRR